MVFSQTGQLLLGLADFCGVLIGRDPSSLSETELYMAWL